MVQLCPWKGFFPLPALDCTHWLLVRQHSLAKWTLCTIVLLFCTLLTQRRYLPRSQHPQNYTALKQYNYRACTFLLVAFTLSLWISPYLRRICWMNAVQSTITNQRVRFQISIREIFQPLEKIALQYYRRRERSLSISVNFSNWLSSSHLHQETSTKSHYTGTPHCSGKYPLSYDNVSSQW